ncbi:MAG: DUF2207 domain-containing protein [Bacilli bacterium]|nr:DUF2207 domain-containing protein [Bacilli bacterium]
MKYLKIFVNVLIFSILFFLILNKINAEEYTHCNDGYCIKKYSVNMVVNEDNSFDITEDIDVYFTEYKHGIFRKLPLRNNVVRNDGTKSSNRAKISNIETSENKSVYNESGYKVIKLGDADVTIIGDKHYKIKYTYDIGKDKAKDFDELYFNIIGTEWGTTIDNVSFSITMPKEYDTSKVGFSAGSKGTIGTTNLTYSTDGNTITGTYNQRLNAYEGITIRIELPEGYFTYEYKPNILGIVGIILPILFAIIAYSIFKKNGVDDVVIETVEFYPPNGYSSLDLGLYYKGNADSKDVTSLLIYLANKGYLKITDRDEEGKLLKHGNFYITKLKEYDGNDSREEKFLKELFVKRKKYSFFGKEIKDENEDKNTVEKSDLTDRFYKTISSILKSTNTKDKRNKMFEKTSFGKSFLMILLGIVPLVILIGYLINAGVDPDLLMAFGMVGMVIYFTLVFALSSVFLKFYDPNQYKASVKTTAGSIIANIIPIIFAIVFCIIFYYGLRNNIDFDLITILTVTVTTLSIASIRACRVGLQKRTQFGNEILGKINGFKNFLETAEKDKLEALVSENPTYFYDILPYTYVLGVSKKWISKFESIAIEPPEWYDYGHTAFNVGMMDTFMDKTIVSAASTLNSSPSDSGGSGGGGSSGGGSGGGGGVSW